MRTIEPIEHMRGVRTLKGSIVTGAPEAALRVPTIAEGADEGGAGAGAGAAAAAAGGGTGAAGEGKAAAPGLKVETGGPGDAGRTSPSEKMLQKAFRFSAAGGRRGSTGDRWGTAKGRVQDLLRRGRTGGEKKSTMMTKWRKTMLRTNVHVPTLNTCIVYLFYKWRHLHY